MRKCRRLLSRALLCHSFWLLRTQSSTAGYCRWSVSLLTKYGWMFLWEKYYQCIFFSIRAWWLINLLKDWRNQIKTQMIFRLLTRHRCPSKLRILLQHGLYLKKNKIKNNCWLKLSLSELITSLNCLGTFSGLAGEGAVLWSFKTREH